MNTHTPSLRKTKDGRWFTKWGGKRHYFGRDEGLAVARYGDSLKRWQAWREKRSEARAIITRDLAGGREPLVIDLVELYLARKTLSKHRAENCRSCLRRFTHAFGHEYITAIGLRHLEAIRNELIGHKFTKNSINHEMAAIKTCLYWGYSHWELPEKSLRKFTRLAVGEPPDKSMSVAQIRAFLMSMPPHIRAWLAVNYLTAARPIEVVRMVNHKGKWVYPGVFRLDEGKTDRYGTSRHVIVPPLAQRWLQRCERRYHSTRSYRDAVTSVCEAAPETVRLRHSAMTHLLDAGVPRADADLVLGHLPGDVSRTYGRIEWTRLVPIAARLSFRHERAEHVIRKQTAKIS